MLHLTTDWILVAFRKLFEASYTAQVKVSRYLGVEDQNKDMNEVAILLANFMRTV